MTETEKKCFTKTVCGLTVTKEYSEETQEALTAQAKQIFEEIASSSKIGEVRDEESTIIFQTFTIRWDAWQNLKAKWCK